MSDDPFSNPPGDPGHAFFQNFQHTPVGARVPEKVGRGVFATAVMVLQTNEIFVLDMLCMASQPQQVVAPDHHDGRQFLAIPGRIADERQTLRRRNRTAEAALSDNAAPFHGRPFAAGLARIGSRRDHVRRRAGDSPGLFNGHYVARRRRAVLGRRSGPRGSARGRSHHRPL